jgi:transposase
MVRHLYQPFGRPNIDPVVFFKQQLIMFYEGFRSERHLMEQVHLNLAYRWFLGYDLNEKVPDHSALSKIRDRYGLEVFQRFFERIVELCIEAGLVWGKELYFDCTRIEANADLDAAVPRFYWEIRQHLAARFNTDELDSEAKGGMGNAQSPASKPRGFTEKYSGDRILSRPHHWYESKADFIVSPTDPDATPMKSSNSTIPRLGYHTHYLVDGGKARIILAVLVTPASIMDNTPLLDLVRWARFRWHIHPEIGVGDSKYGTGAVVAGLEQGGIRAYIPIPDRSEASGFIPAEHFR